MELSHVEKQRTELLQFILLVIIAVLGAVAYLSFQQQQGYLVPGLAGICLCACLYVIGKERHLKRLQSQLVEELLRKQREIAEEQGKSASLEERLSELTRLYRAISTVNSGTDPERTFETVLRAALELVGGDCGSIMLMEEGDDHLVIVTSQGLSDNVVAQTRRKLGEGVVGWVAANREPVLLSTKAHEDERFVGVVQRETEVHFSMSVPLLLRNRVMGVLNLGITPGQSKERFEEYDLRMATIFAQHASVAIENAGLVKNMIGTWNAVRG